MGNIENKTEVDNNMVFVVHGHNEEIKNSVARFLEQLGLKPIILHEQVNSGRTIIQKLIDETSNVSFAIVLYSPCDLGKGKEEENLNARARQNVVFEHGLLIGRLGLSKVCCIHYGEIEMPSDNNGVLYIPYDNGGGWKLKLAQEMKAQGLNIDMNKIR